jgi:hypothetical protein
MQIGNGFDRAVTLFARRVETEYALQAVEKRLGGNFRDAHRAVALHIRVAAQGADAGAGPAHVPAQQEQVGQLLHVGGAVLVLRDAHAVANNDALGFRIHGSGRFNVGAGQAGDVLDLFPRRRLDVGHQFGKAGRVRSNEVLVEQARTGRFERQQRFHHALHGGRVAAYLDLVVRGGDINGFADRHFHRVLGRFEALQAAFLEWIEHDDRCAAQARRPQRAEHARVVGAGVVPEREDGVARVEVFQRDSALADADRLGQAHAGRFVAHVRAVGEIIGAEFTHEQLV